MKTKRAIITGATGFIGSHLARRLVRDGWDVHIIIRPVSKITPLQAILDRVTVWKHDGTTGGMTSIMEQAGPGVVFHLASLFLAQHQPADIEPLVRSNVTFATQLVEAMTAKGIYLLINTGTSWQHFQNEGYDPVCLYAATKQAFEAILKYYIETTPLRVITLKLFDTYGPDDPRPKLFTALRKAAGERKPLAMSRGEQLIDLVFIDDVVAAFCVAAERLLLGQSGTEEEYAVSSGRPVRLRDLVELYARVTGKPLSIEWGGRPYRPREVMAPWNRGAALPGWEPKVTLEEGIKRMEGVGKS